MRPAILFSFFYFFQSISYSQINENLDDGNIGYHAIR